MQAVQGRDAVAPTSRVSVSAVAAVDLVAGAARVGGADLEAGGEDDAVELVFDAVDDDARLGDRARRPCPSVSTRCTFGRLKVGRYSSWKHGPLAELAVPGLQRLGGRRVLRRSRRRARGSASSSRSRRAPSSCAIASGVSRPPCVLRTMQEQVADDVGPAVADQVLVLEAARDEDVEVVHPLLLPAGLEARRPVRIGRPVARARRSTRACAGRRRAASRAAPRCGTHWTAVAPVPMIADALVGELVRPPVGVAAGVVVVPAAGVEGVALEASRCRGCRAASAGSAGRST